jgi:CDP-glycerol glycerophosphotransferase (TagB/SpsB family)/GT2 family glycosyltransferase
MLGGWSFQMLLQELLFPSKGICQEKELYFRYPKNQCQYTLDTAKVIMDGKLAPPVPFDADGAQDVVLQVMPEGLQTDSAAMMQETEELSAADVTPAGNTAAENITAEDALPETVMTENVLTEGILAETVLSDGILTETTPAEGTLTKGVLTDLAPEKPEDPEAEPVPGIIFKKVNTVLKSDTYFNAFSIGKWKKYTSLDNLGVKLVLQGAFRIVIKNVVRQNNEQQITVLQTYLIDEPVKKRRAFAIPIENCREGLVYFEATALSVNSVLYSGFYYTELGENTDVLNPVKFAVDICTFRREEFVIANIRNFETQIINNPASPLFGKLDIYVSDNGNTLDYEALSSTHIHVYPNKNLGGAGGFGRGMYEIYSTKEQNRYTHIIMMDDDVRIDPHVLERNYAFLRLLKPDYSDAFLGGAMLRLDMEWMQSESGDIWYTTGSRPVKYRYDLRRIMWILKNEKEDSLNYFGWWYCCMPISVVQKDNLPLPIFIKRDDIEYGLRNGRHFINVNGICVWHEAFEAKRTPYLDYYYYRNQFIIDSRHRPAFRAEQMLAYYDKEVKKAIDADLELYRYKEAHLKLQGIDDFLKGIDWLKAQDGEVLNNVTMRRRTYRKKPVEHLNCNFTHGVYESSLKFKETKEQEKKRIASHNGWSKPTTKDLVIVPLNNPHPGMVCGAKRVLYYDEESNMGYLVSRSENERDDVRKHFDITRENIVQNFDRVRDEYDDRYEELLSRDFWEKYLFTPVEEAAPIPMEWWEKSAHFTPARVQKAKDQLASIEKDLNRQKHRQFFMPIKKNRVVFYLTNRRGVTCNLKYILLELIKETGNKLDIIWASDFPETCDSIRAMGIPVVKAGSEEHWKYQFTAKVTITNDGQPANFLKRPEQIAINTWHASMNYKTIGPNSLAPRTPEEMKIYLMENQQPDYYLSGSAFFTENTSESFCYDKSIFVPTGMARNDVFFSDYSSIVSKVRKECGVPEGKKIALYAPTFRRGYKIGDFIFDFRRFKAALSKRFGGEWVVLYRGHYFVKNNPRTDSIDVSRYEDMQELMCAADILVSDYSSCLWDFTFTGRPAFVFASDLDEYVNDDRGFALPIQKWPYPVSTNTKELCDSILNFDENDYNERVKLHHEREGSYEKGTSAKAACEIIRKACGV